MKTPKQKKTAKKKVKRRADVERPWCNGAWSTARMRSFIMSALRRAQWAPKRTAIARAFTRKGINPASGKPCMFHRCEACLKEFPKGEMAADHIDPVIPIEHQWEKGRNFVGYDWNEVVRRLFVPEESYQIFCLTCHAVLTNQEKQLRAAHKASQQP
jgi:hypothetical protein